MNEFIKKCKDIVIDYVVDKDETYVDVYKKEKNYVVK